MKQFIEMPKDRKDLDGKEDFSLVEIKVTPHCKKHGAMNKLPNGIWRCFSEYGRDDPREGETVGKFRDRVCNACCLEVNMVTCGKCGTDQDMKKINYGDKPNEFSYWCPKCKDKISPSSCKS